MRALALIAVSLVMLFVTGLALADAEARQGSDFVRITARPCSDPNVLRHIPDSGRQLDFRAATGTFSGQTYSACWTPLRGGIGLVYEDGDQGVVPQADLKPVPEA
jgi:hypothetical protein